MSDIIVGSVGVRLVPNAEGFSAKAKALTQGLTTDVRLNLDDKAARARLDELGRPREAKINASADTAKASAQLDAAAHDRNVKFEASGLSAMVTGALALGPALIPVVAAAGGLAATLGAPLLAAGGGATLFALIAGKAVADTEKQSKAIDQLKTKMDAAKASAASASTAAGKKSALATLATDTKAYNDALNKLNPAQAAFLKAQGALKSSFSTLERTAGTAIFGPLTSGMTTLAKLLPKTAPLLKSVSGAISDVMSSLSDSGALDSFLGFLTKASGPAIRGFSAILGNIAEGAIGIGKAFAPLSGSLMSSLDKMTASFANVGSSNGLASFVAYVQKVGPQVASTLGEIVKAAAHLGAALAPIGGAGLAALKGIARAINVIPTGILGTLAAGLVTAAVGMKALSIASGIAAGVRGLAAAFTEMDAAAVANPVGIVVVALAALAAGLVYAYKHSETFRNVVTGALHAVAAAGKWLWNSALQPALHFIVDAMGHVMVAAGKMLQALGHVPGFGWAKTAGNLMVNAGHAAEGLANDIRKIPGSKSVSVHLNGAGAAAAILAGLQARLNGLQSKTITVAINTATHAVSVASQHGIGGSAEGSTVPKSGPYADRFPYLLAPGEEVISNRHGQADRNRPLLKAINAGRLAVGGTAGWPGAWTSTAWKMPPAKTPDPGNWYHQILAAIHDGLGGPDGASTLADEIRKLNQQIKADTQQASELSKARKGETAAEKASREREVKALQSHEKVLQKQLDALKAQQAAVKAFSLSSVLPTVDPKNPIWAGTKAQLDTFRHDLTKAGGKWTGALQDHAHGMLSDALSLDKATRAQDAATTAAADQKQALDTLTQTMQSFGDSVSGLFKSDLFGLSDTNGPVASSVQGILATLTGDTKNAVGFASLLSKLSGEGLDKGVLSELASKGDVASANVLGSASASDIASINAAAAGRDSALASLSKGSAYDVYGPQFAAQAAATTKANNDLVAATAHTTDLINKLTEEVRELKAIANRPIELDGAVVYGSTVKRNQQATRTTGKNPLASLPGSR